MSKIRLAQIEDWDRVIEIYNQAVRYGLQTADMEEVYVSDKTEWFQEHDDAQYPIFVYELDNDVVGWLSISPYRKGREALRFTAEVSYYIDGNYQKMGIGSQLMKYALNRLPQLGIKSLFAILLDVNIGSIKLLEKFGFKKWGHLPNIADFNGKVCGQYYYGYQIEELKQSGDKNGR